MKRLDVLAQDVMDAYYQNPYVDDNEQPFDHAYFVRACMDEYASILSKQFLAIWQHQRSEGYNRTHNVSLDNAWLVWEQVKIERDESRGDYFGKLKHAIMSFDYDQSDIGLHDVVPVRVGKCNPVRDRRATSWMDKMLPPTNAMFYRAEGSAVRFNNNCCPEVMVGYVPAPHEDMQFKDAAAADIKRGVLQFMMAARQGVVVDMTNDSNTNTSPQTELNKETLK